MADTYEWLQFNARTLGPTLALWHSRFKNHQTDSEFPLKKNTVISLKKLGTVGFIKNCLKRRSVRNYFWLWTNLHCFMSLWFATWLQGLNSLVFVTLWTVWCLPFTQIKVTLSSNLKCWNPVGVLVLQWLAATIHWMLWKYCMYMMWFSSPNLNKIKWNNHALLWIRRQPGSVFPN